MELSYRVYRHSLIKFCEIIEDKLLNTLLERVRLNDPLIEAEVEGFLGTQLQLPFEGREVGKFRLIFIQPRNVKNLKDKTLKNWLN